MINPGLLPLGFASEATQISRKTHRIDLPNENSEGESDYGNILKMIMDFIGAKEFQKSKMPPLYTGLSTEEIDGAMLTLDILAQENDYEFNAFQVFPIDSLFYKLQHKCIELQTLLKIKPNKPLSSQVFAKSCLQTDDDYEYSPIGCEYHNEIDTPNHCCLSKVKRWGYCIAKYCIDTRFEIIPGRHCPDSYGFCDKKITLQDSEPNFGFLRLRTKNFPKPAKPSKQNVPSKPSVDLSKKFSKMTLTTANLSAANTGRSHNWLSKFLAGCDDKKEDLNTTDSSVITQK
jgi:hypothetical protein